MKQYLGLLNTVLMKGRRQKNRTGIDTYMIPGYMLNFDMEEGFPAVTSKKLAFEAVKGELLGFLGGVNTISGFNGLGCKVWDANGKAEFWQNNPNCKGPDDLGRIYGVQWRGWKKTLSIWGHIKSIFSKQDTTLDQIKRLISEIESNPTSRRLLVTAWRPDEIDQMALAPCHYGFQVIIEQNNKTMHLLWNQRSNDSMLGTPFNIASYAILLHLLCRVTGYTPGTLTGFLADVHIYENHLPQVREQLGRTTYPLPKLVISDRITKGFPLEEVKPEDIWLEGYKSHPAIKAPMAV